MAPLIPERMLVLDLVRQIVASCMEPASRVERRVMRITAYGVWDLEICIDVPIEREKALRANGEHLEN